MATLFWIAFLCIVTTTFVDARNEGSGLDRSKRNRLRLPRTSDCRPDPERAYAGTKVRMFHTSLSRNVLCDISTDGGGWVVFQRRLNATDYTFNKTWTEYRNGFGSVYGTYWLGNEDIYQLTNDGIWDLRIGVTSGYGANRTSLTAEYTNFRIDSEANKYTLHLGEHSGSLIDGPGYGFSAHNNTPFSTFDRENDISYWFNCASAYGGGWWYKSCIAANLNPSRGVHFEWYHRPGARSDRTRVTVLSTSEMMMRKRN